MGWGKVSLVLLVTSVVYAPIQLKKLKGSHPSDDDDDEAAM